MIEIVWPCFGEPFQGIGQTPEGEVRDLAVRRTDRWQTPRQPDSPALVVLLQAGRSIGDLEGREPVDGQACPRQRYRRLDQLTPWQPAKPLDCQSIASHRARDHEGERATAVA